MAEEISLENIESLPATEFEGDIVDLTQIRSTPVEDFKGDVIDIDEPQQIKIDQPDIDKPSFFDLLQARSILGVSNTLSARPEDNLSNVQAFIPSARLDNDGNVEVPNPETGAFEPLVNQAGFTGDFIQGVVESGEPVLQAAGEIIGGIVGGVAGAPTGPGAAATAVGGALFGSQLGSRLWEVTAQQLGVKDSRTLLDIAEDVAIDSIFELGAPKVLQKAGELLVKAPIAVGKFAKENTLRLLSKFVTLPDNEKGIVVSTLDGIRKGVATKNAKDVVDRFVRNGLPRESALELVYGNNTVRKVIETVSKSPFSNLDTVLEKNKEKVIDEIISIPSKLEVSGKKIRVKTPQTIGVALQKGANKFKLRSSEIQGGLRRKVLEGIEKETVIIDDLIEEVNQNADTYRNIPNTNTLLNLPEYRKIAVDFKNIDDAASQLPSGSRIDLSKAGSETKKALSDFIGKGKIKDAERFIVGAKDLETSESVKSLNFDELINLHQAIKGTISDNSLNGLRRTSQEMQPMIQLERKVRDKLNTFLQSKHPERFKIKLEADKQWIRDTDIIEKGLDKIASRGVTPGQAYTAALANSELEDTRLLNIKKAVNKVDKKLWPEFSVSVMDRFGKSNNNQIGFDLNQWQRNYNKLSREAKGTLFGDIPGLNKKLDDFSNIVALYKESAKDLNTSRTATTLPYLPGFIMKTLTSAQGLLTSGATYLTGRLLKNKDFMDFLVDGLDPKKIKTIVNDQGERAFKYAERFKPSQHILRLGVIARNNADIREDVKLFMRGLDESMRDENLKEVFKDENLKRVDINSNRKTRNPSFLERREEQRRRKQLENSVGFGVRG